ncbi:MAG TPA: hypothetical protein VK524_34075 [Polyangiaceae bacterium]|nr:hypothetical protein [Polyangiaceae bacterium]
MTRRLALLLAVLASACGAGALPEPTPLDATRISKQFPDATLATLEHGRKLYAGRCADCHQLYEPARYGADKWRTELGEMRERARLSAEEERMILQYLVSVGQRGSTGQGS